MEDNIKGKVVIITGGSSGLGENTARHLASRGAKVVIAARRKEKLEAIADDIRKDGGEALVVETDVTKRDDLKNLIELSKKEYGKIDVLINNAGLMAIAPLAEDKVEEWDKMIDINVKGVLYGISAALPVFQEQGFGHFINLSSVAGIKVFSPGGTVYSGTKYAVRAISDGLRHEVGGNIRTTTIEPGAIDSELKYGSSHDKSSENVKEFYKQAIPGDSIARAIAYAIEQPKEVDVNEIVIRPTVQEF